MSVAIKSIVHPCAGCTVDAQAGTRGIGSVTNPIKCFDPLYCWAIQIKHRRIMSQNESHSNAVIVRLHKEVSDHVSGAT